MSHLKLQGGLPQSYRQRWSPEADRSGAALNPSQARIRRCSAPDALQRSFSALAQQKMSYAVARVNCASVARSANLWILIIEGAIALK